MTDPSGRRWQKLASVAVSAAIAEVVSFPLDFYKSRLQMNRSLVDRPSLMKIVSSEGGIRVLYSGLAPAVVRHFFYSTIRVSVFEALRDHWKSSSISSSGNASVPLPYLLVAGMVAGGVGQAVASPTDLIKLQLQKPSTPHTRSITYIIRYIVEKEGALGLWRGSLPAIQRAGLVNLGELATYDAAKRAVLQSGITQGQDNVYTHVTSSMMSGFVSAIISTPADVMKTRLMAQNLAENHRQYKGIVDCFQRTLAEEGLRGLYKGFYPTWARLGPWQLTFWVTFEHVRKLQGLQGF